MPLSFAVRFTLFRTLTFGPDLGYAISLNADLTGDLYLKGVIGLDIANFIEVNLFISNVYQGENAGFTSAGFGTLIHIY